MPPTDKRQAILDAALALFAEHGFDGTPVPAIADAAGVATGSIYRHFASKEALVNALYQHWKERFRDRLSEGYDATAAPREQFHRLWCGMAAFQREAPQAFAFLEMHSHLPYLDTKSVQLTDDVMAIVRNFVDSARVRGALKPIAPELAIALVFGAFVYLIKQKANGCASDSDGLLEAAEHCAWDAIKL